MKMNEMKMNEMKMKEMKMKEMKMKEMKMSNIALLIGILVLLININIVSAELTQFGGGTISPSLMGGSYRVIGSAANPQFNQPSFFLGSGIDPKMYWSNFDREDCKERQDVVLMIPPGGCSPSVVRSDLLEEQDVPVFCKVSSIQVNPLIDITKIRSIRFKGEYPKGVASVKYYPARAGVRSFDKLVASPIVDNIGYLVVVLKRQASEVDMADVLEANVTAIIDYDSEGVFGVGKHDFFLPETDDAEWQTSYKDYGFWKGKGFIRLDSIDEDSARVSIYRDATNRETSITLRKGETSGDIFLGGYYCAAGMNIKLVDSDYPVDTALLRVDDEDIWVADGGKFLDGECRVRTLEPSDIGGGRIGLSCTGAGSFDLMLDKGITNLQVDGEEKQYSVGEKIKTFGDENIHVAYIGRFLGAKSDYIILVSDNPEENKFYGMSSFISRKEKIWHSLLNVPAVQLVDLFKGIAGDFFQQTVVFADGYDYEKEEFRFYQILLSKLKVDYKITNKNIRLLIGEGAKWEEQNIILQKPISGERFLEDNPELKENYEKAVENYNEVVELYPNEKAENDKNNFEETYAAQALFNLAGLSGKLGLRGDQIKYLEKLIENYPDSNLAISAKQELELAYKGRNTKDSQAIVYINNEAHFISLREMSKPTYEDLGAKLMFINRDTGETISKEFEKDIVVKIPTTGGIGLSKIIKVTDIYEDFVEIKYNANFELKKGVANLLFLGSFGQTVIWEKETLEIGKQVALTPEVSVRLERTNLNRQAQVQIIPKVFGTRTESDFSFKIAIEKRGIKLSPEKTEEMMNNLAEQIKKWEEINSKLGNVVKGLKGACFATSAMLTVKNLFSGMSGESMARNEVMTGEGGWNENCRKWSGKNAIKSTYNDNTYSSVQSCLLDHNTQIEQSVNTLADYYKSENNKLEEIQKNHKIDNSDILDFEGAVDSEAVKKEYCEDVFNSVDLSGEVEIKGKGKVQLKGEKGIYSDEQIQNCDIDLSDMKLLRLRDSVKGDAFLKNLVDERVANELEYTYQVNQENKKEGIIKSKFGDISIFRDNDKVRFQGMSDVDKSKPSQNKFNNEIVKTFGGVIGNKEVIVGLSRKDGNDYFVKQVIDSSGNDITNDVYTTLGEEEITYGQYYSYYKDIDVFTEANSELYKNKITDSDAKVKYYSRAPYEGLPSLVPFGKVGQTDGWYVTTDYILSGFGKPYEKSGRAVNFWICNVGKNGLIDGKGRDDCRYYNLGSTSDLDFPGLSKGQSASLVKEAENAIRQANRGYGKKQVMVNGKSYNTDFVEGGESGKCSDFMSPKDCNLMFNVCDPVICPASRCDFGGKYRVSNVVQSGIIGSLTLCLPNAQEGIAVPICLSGVHAGIESYVGILKSAEGCLNESLETGRNIGICDEIKSVYLCEFFWRQAIPLMEVFVPRIFEFTAGQGARGGGEYLTVNSAWENMQASVDYFKDEYAVNSIKAFNDRSTAEVGGEVCKSFVSARYPNSKDFIDNLVEPDSPVQFTGWFSEDVLTDATIPSMSHYKVYYHIYAGKDIGSSYVVYLKDPPQSSYINTLGRYVVDRGYIERGQQVDEARDFSSISGYSQLCININGQEECGFKQVSTSWFVDEISNKYAEEQASQTDITSAEQCVAGTTSLWSFAQPNLEAGADEALNPELYKRGIIRVCSSGNPGAQTEVNLGASKSTRDRWKKVGTCGSDSVGCWLDTDSVENVLRDAPGVAEEVLDQVDISYLGDIVGFTEKKSKDGITAGKKFHKGINGEWEEGLDDVIIILTGLSEIGFDNSYRANAFFLMGEIYGRITEKIYGKKLKTKTGTGAGAGEDGEGTAVIKDITHKMEKGDELFVTFFIENKGEKADLKVQLFNENKDYIDQEYLKNFENGEEREVTLSTYGKYGDFYDVGESYIIGLFKEVKADEYVRVESKTMKFRGVKDEVGVGGVELSTLTGEIKIIKDGEERETDFYLRIPFSFGIKISKIYIKKKIKGWTDKDLGYYKPSENPSKPLFYANNELDETADGKLVKAYLKDNLISYNYNERKFVIGEGDVTGEVAEEEDEEVDLSVLFELQEQAREDFFIIQNKYNVGESSVKELNDAKAKMDFAIEQYLKLREEEEESEDEVGEGNAEILSVESELIKNDELTISVVVRNNLIEEGDFIIRLYKRSKQFSFLEGRDSSSLKKLVFIEKGKSREVVFNTDMNPFYDRGSFKDGYFVGLFEEEGNNFIEISGIKYLI